MYHEDGISVLVTDKSQKERYQENMDDEEGFQIHIQLLQSWQPVTCVKGRCPARAGHCESVFLVSFLRFPGASASLCLYNIHRLLCYLAHDHPFNIPKDSGHQLSLVNKPSKIFRRGWARVLPLFAF